MPVLPLPQPPTAPRGSPIGAIKGSLLAISGLEMDSAIPVLGANYYKTFSYTGNDLTGMVVWTDDTMTEKVFEETLTYAAGRLAQSVLTRFSDGAVMTRDYTWDQGKLTAERTFTVF